MIRIFAAALLGFCLAARAAAPVELQPSRLDLPPVAVGTAATGLVQVVFGAESTGSVTRVSFARGAFRASVGGGEFAVHPLITVVLPPTDTTAGRIEDELLVETNHPDARELRLPVSATLRPRISVTPPVLLLRRTPGTETNAVSRFLLLRAGTEGPFEILGVEWPSARGKATFTRAGAAGHRIDLLDIVPDLALHGRNLRVRTNLAALPMLEIPIRVMDDRATGRCAICLGPGGHAGPHPGKPAAPVPDKPFRPEPALPFQP